MGIFIVTRTDDYESEEIIDVCSTYARAVEVVKIFGGDPDADIREWKLDKVFNFCFMKNKRKYVLQSVYGLDPTVTGCEPQVVIPTSNWGRPVHVEGFGTGWEFTVFASSPEEAVRLATKYRRIIQRNGAWYNTEIGRGIVFK